MRKTLFLYIFIIAILPLSACENSPQTSHVVSSSFSSLDGDAEPQEGDTSSIVSFEDALKDELINAFGDNIVFDYDSVSYYSGLDESTIYIAIFPDGSEDCYIAAHNSEDNSELAATWKEYQATIIELNKLITEQAGKPCEFTICSDRNHHIKLITIFGGKIVYDWFAD